MSTLRLLSFVALCLASQLALAQSTSVDECPTCGYGSQATTIAQGQPMPVLIVSEDACPTCSNR